MPITFPNSPSTGDTHTTSNGLQYTYDGEKWTTIGTNSAGTWTRTGTTVSLTTATDDLNVDSGTLFVDASTNRVGIGTASPQTITHVLGANPVLRIQDNSTAIADAFAGIQLAETGSGESLGNYWQIALEGDSGTSTDHLTFKDGTGERMRIDSSGNVGIGTASPSNTLSLEGSGTGLSINSTNDEVKKIEFKNSGTTVGYFGSSASSPARFISSSAAELMRLDSSGRLLVGTSSNTDDYLFQVDSATSKTAQFTRYGSDGATIVIGSSRGTQGAKTALNNNDYGGLLTFKGYDGSNFQTLAWVAAQCDGQSPASGDSPGRLVFSTTANGAASPTEQIRLDNSGNLNFAQEASSNYPEQKLKWSNDSTTANGFYISQDSSRNGKIFHEQGLDIVFGTNNSERMRLDSSGRLLVGTSSSQTTPTASSFQVSGGGFDTSSIRQTRFASSGNGPALILAHARGSASSPQSLANNDELGKIRFYGHDGTDFNNFAAEISGEVDGSVGSNDMPARLVFSTSASGANTATERMRIDSSGNVGIGDSAPSEKLNVAGNIMLEGSDRYIYYTNAGTGNSGIYVRGRTATAELRSHSTGIFTWEVTGNEKMRIDSSGRVGIGVTSMSAHFEVHVNAASRVPVIINDTNNTNSHTHRISFKTGGVEAGRITSNRTSTSYVTSSDHRLKENVIDIIDGITRVKQLQPKRFNFIADADTTVDGFLAHEAQAIVPEAVTGTHDEVDDDGNAVMQGIDQSKLVPLLTAALQEAIAKIETLETKVAALEAG
jgi:hypothetical protein